MFVAVAYTAGLDSRDIQANACCQCYQRAHADPESNTGTKRGPLRCGTA